MLAQEALIKRAIQKGAVTSHIALAKRLGITSQTVSQWKSGDVPMSDERIEEIAAIAGEDPGRWKLAIMSERTKSEAIRRSLRAIMEKAGIGLAALWLCVVPLQSKAYEFNGLGKFASLEPTSSVYYVIRLSRQINNHEW